ncbi:MAG: TRAP transporter substrate-binding protein DctP [Anaerolineales bacterium]|nr:TRAP transporter substrate-binding protein DctP [Anaerolineales bacterium]
MTENQEIGQRVRVSRRAMGLRQSDLSEMTALPASHVSDIERGALTPTIPTLRKIADALERPLVYFLQATEDEPRSVGMVINISSIGGQAAVRFAELVEEKTDGEHKVRIYGHSMLGTASEQIEGLVEGAIPIYIDELLAFECVVELCGPICLPYFFRDKDHYHAFLQSAIFEEHIYRKLLKKGIRLLKPVSNWGSGSFEMLLSTDPIFSPRDLMGRKFRSYDSPAAIALRSVLGAEPVVVDWAYAPQAFKEGGIDTFLTPAIYLNALRPHEFAKNATLLAYGYTLGLTVAVNDRAYRRMSPDLQSALVEAAQEAGAYCTPLVNEQTKFTLERLPTEYGLPIIHPDQNAWRQSLDAVIRQICEGGLLPRKMYEEIQSL